MKWKVMSILVVLLLLVPSIMAVPQTQDNGNNLQEEESKPLEPMTPPKEPEPKAFYFKRIVVSDYIFEVDKTYTATVMIFVSYGFFTGLVRTANMYVYTGWNWPFYKLPLTVDQEVTISDDCRSVDFHYDCSFKSVWAPYWTLEFYFNFEWEAWEGTEGNSGWFLPA